MRVLSGRLKAVLVALLATIILIGVSGPATTVAADPPGLARFMYALGKVESGGNYYARNPVSGAYGKYQIIPSSWRAWADRYLGNPDAKQTPANQEIVAGAKIRSYYRSLDSWRRVAYIWLTGSSQTSGWSSYATRYVDRVMRLYSGAGARAMAVSTTAERAALRRYSDKSPSIAYAGSWRSAGHSGYAGDTVRYSIAAGASATLAFTGSKVTWYGPVGPTRGRARVYIDGTLVTTVDLHRSSFKARQAVFSRSFATAGAHTIRIEVVGTAGHPYVAIDELAVAP